MVGERPLAGPSDHLAGNPELCQVFRYPERPVQAIERASCFSFCVPDGVKLEGRGIKLESKGFRAVCCRESTWG